MSVHSLLVTLLLITLTFTSSQYVPAGTIPPQQQPPVGNAATPPPAVPSPPQAAPAAPVSTEPTVPTTPAAPATGTPINTNPTTQQLPARYALRHSFRPPFQRSIPFWNAGAGAFVNETYVRITPARQSRTGYLWNTVPVEMSDWQIEMEFSVSGMKQLGGDGFALWFVEKSEVLGTVYGSADYWNGLGIFFDTFNNDNVGSNPLITAIYNDGTQKFDYTSDGATQALSSCSFDFRNLDTTTFAKIMYKDGKLSIDIAIHRSVTDNSPAYQPCLSVNVELGVDKYFGITAHTGDVADNHDIHSFIVTDLSPSSVDLLKIREHYQQQLQAKQSTPDHLEMNTQQFQHSVLTTLAQIQGEVNLLEVGQLALSDYLHTQLVVPLSTGAVPTPIPSAAASSQAAAAADINPQTLLKLDTVHDTNTKVLQEVRTLAGTVQMLSSAINQRPTPGTPTSPQPAAVDTTSMGVLNAAIQQLDLNVKSIQSTLQQLNKKNDDLSSLLNNIIRTQTQHQTLLSQTVSNLQSMTEKHSQSLASAAAAQSIGVPAHGGLGWFAYGLIIFGVVCIASLTFHTFRQHMKKERYKLV